MTDQILPLGIKDRTKTELPALVALQAIGKPWFTEDHRCDLMSIALVAQLLAVEEKEIHAASCDLIALLGPDDLDIDRIAPLVVAINDWIQLQPNGRVQNAVDRLLGRAPRKTRRKGSRGTR
jgi:hypothetical protein